MSWCVFLGFILYGTVCASWTCVTIFFPMLRTFSTVISSNIFSDTFFFSSSGTPIIQMLVHLVLSQRSLRLPSILFIHSFFFILLLGSYFHLFICQLTYPFFCLIYPVIDSFRVFLISVIVLFITVCLLFHSSRSLLNVSCIFSILFLRFWIIFTIITLNSFSGRLPISSSFI